MPGRVCILGSGIASTSSGHFVDGLDKMCVYPLPDDCFHHSQMLEVVVCLEQGVSGEELDKNAPDAPDIARKRPSQTEYDLGGTVVTCGNDR